MDMLQYIAQAGMVVFLVTILQGVKGYVDRGRMKKGLPKLHKYAWWSIALALGVGCGFVDQSIVGFTTVGATIDACIRYAGGMGVVYNGYKAGRGN